MISSLISALSIIGFLGFIFLAIVGACLSIYAKFQKFFDFGFKLLKYSFRFLQNSFHFLKSKAKCSAIRTKCSNNCKNSPRINSDFKNVVEVEQNFFH